MIRFSSLKIGTRLSLGFGFVALQLVLGTVLGIWSSRTVNSAQKEALAEAGHLRSAMKIETAFGEFYGTVWRLLHTEEPGQRQALLARIAETQAICHREIDSMKAAEQDPAALASIRSIEDPLNAASGLNQEIVDLSSRGEQERAIALFLGRGETSRTALARAVASVVAEQDEHVKRFSGSADSFVVRIGRIMLAGSALGVFVAFGIGAVITRSVTRPLGMSVDLVGRVGRGDVSIDVPEELRQRGDEVGNVARSLQEMVESLRNVLSDVTRGVETLASSATHLTATSAQTSGSAKGVADRATTVASAAEHASANTSSVATSMEQASYNLSSVASATEQMSATVGEIAANSEKARVISEEANTQARTISTLMQQLGDAAREIGKVTEAITDISSQTNLLALNATIEAARAGAAGKGFAVVANEIKELARQTATATEDIKSKIAGVQTSAGGAISDIEKISAIIKDVGGIVSSIAAAIEEQAAVTKDVASNIAQATAGVKDANDRVAQTAAVSRAIAKDISDVNGAMGEIRQGGESVESSASDLARLADHLKLTVAHFRV